MFNAEKEIERCINSIKNQTFKNIEVILFNDGSTDTTKLVCEKLIARNKRFRLFEHDNIGPGKTRDKAIRLATGDFILFLDSDDTIEPETIEVLIKTQRETQVDIVNYSYNYIQNGIREKRKSVFPKDKIISKVEFKDLLKVDFPDKKELLWFSWINLIRKDLIVKNQIFHTNNLKVGVDSTFNLNCFLNANGIYSTSHSLYNYHYNENSLTQKPFRKYFFENIELQFLDKKRILEEHGLGELEYTLDLSKYYMQHSLFYLFQNEKKSERGLTINWLKNIRNSELYLFCVKHYRYSSYLTLKKRVVIFLFRKRLFVPLYLTLKI